MKIALNLLGFKGYSCLKAVIDNKFNNLICITVVNAPDKALTNDYFDEIKGLCESNNIPYFSKEEITDYQSFDYVIAVGWRWLIKNVNESKLIIFHDSLLPKYRGFAPLVNAALNREENVGVTALFGAEEYDKGAIIAQKAIDVIYPIRISELIELITPCYTDLITKVLTNIVTGVELIGKNQIESRASYSVWLDSRDYFIDWKCDSEFIANKINLLGAPYQPAQCFMDGKVVKLHAAELYRNLTVEHRHIGKVLIVESGCPVVICVDGLIKITKMTDENGNSLIPFKFFRVRFQ